MHYADIHCLLTKSKITLTDIATEEGVTVSFVSQVVRGTKTSFSVASNIARKVKRSINTLWPNKYNHTPRPLQRPESRSRAAA